MNYFTRLKNLKLEPKRIDDLIFREAELDDVRKVAELYRLNFPEHILVKRKVLSYPKRIRQEFLTDSKKWLLTSLDDRIVGSSALEISDWNSAAEIERVVVAKELRGNGIAKEMCRTLTEDVAEPIGVKYLFAHARGQEYGMQKALQDNGFKVGGIMPVFYVNHGGREIRENFVYMYKFLNNGEKEVESNDRLIPIAKTIKDILEKQYK